MECARACVRDRVPVRGKGKDENGGNTRTSTRARGSEGDYK